MDLPSISSTASISENSELKSYYENLLYKNDTGRSISDLSAYGDICSTARSLVLQTPQSPANFVTGEERKYPHKMGHLQDKAYIDSGKYQPPVLNMQLANNLDCDYSYQFYSARSTPSHGYETLNAETINNSSPCSSCNSFYSDAQSGPIAQAYVTSGNRALPTQRRFSDKWINNTHNATANHYDRNSYFDGNYYSGSSEESLRRISSNSDLMASNNNSSFTVPSDQVHLNNKGVGSCPDEGQLMQQSYKPSRSSVQNRAASISHTPNQHSLLANHMQQQTQKHFMKQTNGTQSWNNNFNSSVKRRGNNKKSNNPHHSYQNQNTKFHHEGQQYSCTDNSVQFKPHQGQKTQLDNGLVMIDGQIVSSPQLHLLYLDCGSRYYSNQTVFEFIDYLKIMFGMVESDQALLCSSQRAKSLAMLSFLDFLRSCNMNFTVNAEVMMAGLLHMNIDSMSEEMIQNNMDYKPLVLVAQKNGKLELLSKPQATCLSLQRGDMVIVEGDRGKDLVVVVEPAIDFNLAMFVNFLKKKIHFDSLITSYSQHYSNSEFIDRLRKAKNGDYSKLNSKLYDVIELTELVIPSKQVLRFATPWEATTNLHSKFQDELKALSIAQIKLRTLNQADNSNSSNHKARPKLNIKILNSEFQFDRKKLIFYYICKERNDFRELIKELFKFYKTRIWLCAIPNNLDIDSKYHESKLHDINRKVAGKSNQHGKKSTDFNSGKQCSSAQNLAVIPSLNKVSSSNFQIGIYKELVAQLF